MIKQQLLSKKFYNHHVPKALALVSSAKQQSFNLLNSAHIGILKSYFDKTTLFKLIFVGSEHEFSSAKFHQFCDNKGPTLSVAKSEHDHVFGFFVEAPWESEGDNKSPEVNSFLIKITG